MSITHRGYRADIDGLRAIAVLAVVFAHADVAGFAGGFVGVDVFFVISGFLIAGNLARPREPGFRPFWRFYARRLRRTLPALYLVAGVTFGVGAWRLMPGALDDLARSLVAAVLFVPNILFLTQVGYFDHDALSKSFLHSWSLGVEEQFYLVAPLLPLCLNRLAPAGRGVALLALFAGGLIACLALRAFAPAAAFYLMPARLWEFTAGWIVAENALPQLRSRGLAEAISAVALLVLCAAIILVSPGMPQPGLPTVLACLATATLIHAGSAHLTRVGRFLGSRPLAGIGLISYSIYLWHWPAIVLTRDAGLPPSPAMMLAAGGGLLCVSALSWRFVEQPFRASGSWVRRRAAPVLIASAGFLVTASLAVSLDRGWPGRFPPEIASVASFYDYASLRPYRQGQCFMTSKDWLNDFDRATCLHLDPERRNVLLLGDSHAADLWTALRDGWPTTNFLQATASGCKPLLGATGARRCTTMMADLLQTFMPAHRLDGVILSAFWEPADIGPLKATIAYLKPLVGSITVFGPAVRYDEPLATLLAKSLYRDTLAGIGQHEIAMIPDLDADMRAEIAPLTRYISLYEAICPAQHCRRLAAPGIPMQFDGHHFTKEGAAVLMSTVRMGHPDIIGPP